MSLRIKFTILLSILMLMFLVLKQDVMAKTSCEIGYDACFDQQTKIDCLQLDPEQVSQCQNEKTATVKECFKIKQQCEGIKEVPEGSMLPTSLKDAGGRLFLLNKDKMMGSKPFEQVVGGYIKTGLALVGVIFLLLMVYGGYTWMIARGDETEATKAKDTITMAAIGMAVVLIAYVITYFILSYALQSVGQ